MANDIICEISSENELICEMSSAGEIVVEINGMTYQSVAAELAEKASVEDVALKADKTYVDNQDSLKADKTYVDSQVALKADKTYVDTQDLLKADKTYVDNQDAALTAQLAEKANKAQETWIEGTLIGWENFAVTFPPFRYYKDDFGMVHLSGAVKGGTPGTATVYTFPVGYRPEYNVNLATASTSGSFGQLSVFSASGYMRITLGSSTIFTFDGVLFKAVD